MQSLTNVVTTRLTKALERKKGQASKGLERPCPTGASKGLERPSPTGASLFFYPGLSGATQRLISFEGNSNLSKAFPTFLRPMSAWLFLSMQALVSLSVSLWSVSCHCQWFVILTSTVSELSVGKLSCRWKVGRWVIASPTISPMN
jgi:hypothetical protein